MSSTFPPFRAPDPDAGDPGDPGFRPWERIKEATRAVSNLVRSRGELVVSDAGKVYVPDGSKPLKNLSPLMDAASVAASYGTLDNEGYDIVLLLGQSNMSGRGTPYDQRLDPPDSRIYQYGSAGTASAYASVISQAIEPLVMHDAPSGIGPGLVFARWYASSLPLGRRVLLVPAAHGGTPLSSTATLGWRRGVSGNLYAQALAQAQAALAAAGPNSSVVAALWVQGETDGDSATSGSQYQTDLDALITGLRTDLALPNLPFVIGQMVIDFLATGTRAAINTVQSTTPSRIPKTAFAQGVAGQSLGDGNHYNAVAQRTQGRALYTAYRRIIRGNADPAMPATLGAVTGVTTGAVSQSSVALSWTALTGAAVYSVQYKLTSSSTWTIAATTTATTATVAALTASTSYDFRVVAINAAGPGAASSTATASTSAPQLLLDSLGVSADRAYSLRKLRSASTKAVNVRRSSDNTTSDIGFSGSGLDTAALLAFAGAGSAYVVTWYDQSGNAKDITQATAAAQPTIVNAGAVVTSGGQPAVSFDGTDDVLFASNPALYAAGAATVCAVLRGPTPTVAGRWWAESVSTLAGAQYGLVQPNFANQSYTDPVISTTDASGATVISAVGSAAVFNNSIHQLSGTDTSTAVAQWVDGVADIVSTAYTRPASTAKDRFAIGGVVRSGSLASAIVSISEAVFFTSALSTGNRQSVEGNQKSAFGTP